MILNKILYIIDNIDIIDDLKKVGIENFLFPLKGFTVGFPNAVEFIDIPDNSYILINRILDCKSLDLLKELLIQNKKIKGIVYDDFGVLHLINELNLDVEKICYQNHFATNYKSINENLEYSDSVVVSTDITKNEIVEIQENVNKEIVLFAFGLVQAMYSRRTLLHNFYEEFSLEENDVASIYENVSDNNFLMVQNEYGTVGYQKKYFNGFELFDNTMNVKYYLVNPLFLNKKEQLELVNCIKNKKFDMNIDFDYGFLNKETIYKLKGE